MVDGPGFRTSIYCAGCRHACPGCHNPQSWDFGGGRDMTVEAAGFAELARQIHRRTQKDIWCYTGFTFESLIHDDQRELLAELDVLVDGPFIQALHDSDLLFRGSSNQRLIDVQTSMYSGKTVLWKPEL